MPILLEKTIGKLRKSVSYDDDLSKYSFAVKFKHLRCWNDFGTWNEEERTIYQNGESKEINIDNYLFDNKIRNREHFVSSRNETTFYFTINGMTPAGKIFELKFTICGKDDVLVYIVYSMVLISFLGPEKAKEIWENLYGDDWRRKSIDEQLKFIKEIKTYSENITNRYPFMAMFLQEGSKKIVAQTKSALDSLEF